MPIIRIIKSSRMGWSGRVARMGEEPGENRVSVGRPEGMRPIGRWEDNIKSRY